MKEVGLKIKLIFLRNLNSLRKNLIDMEAIKLIISIVMLLFLIKWIGKYVWSDDDDDWTNTLGY